MLASLQTVRRRTALTRRANTKKEIIGVKHLYYSTHRSPLAKSGSVEINSTCWSLILNTLTHSTVNLPGFHGIFSSTQIMITVAPVGFASVQNCVCTPPRFVLDSSRSWALPPYLRGWPQHGNLERCAFACLDSVKRVWWLTLAQISSAAPELWHKLGRKMYCVRRGKVSRWPKEWVLSCSMAVSLSPNTKRGIDNRWLVKHPIYRLKLPGWHRPS